MNQRQRKIQKLINKKRIDQIDIKTHGITPQIYAAFAIELDRDGWDADKIEDLFFRTQCLWQDCIDNGVNMCELCEKTTGIDVSEE